MVAILVAAFVSALMPATAGALHQNLYQATMMPPTHSSANPAQLSYNSCGWHSGACHNPFPDGPALDWGYYNGSTYDTVVRFRGWLYRSSTSYPYGWLALWGFQQQAGSLVCDESVADVIELAPYKTRYGMHYLHTTSYGGSGGQGYDLFANGNGIGAWNNRNVAYMIADSGCPWQAYNTHAWAVNVKLSYYS